MVIKSKNKKSKKSGKGINDLQSAKPQTINKDTVTPHIKQNSKSSYLSINDTLK